MTEHILTNREKSQQANKAKFWCGCDMAMIGEIGKCPACGSYHDKKRKK